MSSGQAIGAHFLPGEGEWAGWWKWGEQDPYEEHVGPFYAQRESDGRLITGFRPRAFNMRTGAITHGGALMSFADYSLFIAAYDELLGADAVTVSFNAEFLSAAPGGSLLVGRAEVMRSGRRLLFVRGALLDGPRAVLSFSGVISRRG